MKKLIAAAMTIAALSLAGCKNAGYGTAQPQNEGVGGSGTAGGPNQNAPPMRPIEGPSMRGPQGDGMGAAAQDFAGRNVNELDPPPKGDTNQSR